MSERMDKIKEAVAKLGTAIKLLQAADPGAADNDADAAHDALENVETSINEELATSPDATGKLESALGDIVSIKSDLEDMGSFDDVEEDEVQEVVDTLEGYINTLNEIAL